MKSGHSIIAFCAIYLILSVPVHGLTIIPTFDGSITNDPQAATIENTINQALQVYQTSFSDPITVHIEFSEMTGGLGANSFPSYGFITYSNYLAALKSRATTAYDAVALAHLPNGPTNPVNGSQSMNLQPAIARALGFVGGPDPTQIDGTVYLNTSIMNLDRTSINPGKYDLTSVASHEINEVLGMFSALNELTNGAPAPTGNIWPMDLFRYTQNQNGTRSFDTALSTQAYFSLDGTNLLVRFSQSGGLDFSDWYGWTTGVVPQVQDSVTAPGTIPNLGIEKIALDVIGFSLVPSSLAPVFTSETKTNGTIRLAWSSVPGLNYQLQATTNLASTSNWTNVLANPITATNNTTSASDSIGPASRRFYRVILLGVTPPATNPPPVLPVQTNRVINPLNTLIVTNTATDAVVPAPVLTYSLTSNVTGTNQPVINPTNGVITWMPDVGQAGTSNVLTTIVTASGVPALSATNSFEVVVNPVPVLGSVIYTNGGFLLTWFAPTNDQFMVQWTGGLTPPQTWSSFSNIVIYTGPPTPTNGLFSFFDNGTQYPFNGPRFYRIVLLPP